MKIKNSGNDRIERDVLRPLIEKFGHGEKNGALVDSGRRSRFVSVFGVIEQLFKQVLRVANC
jgi:hypothetical protein